MSCLLLDGRIIVSNQHVVVTDHGGLRFTCYEDFGGSPADTLIHHEYLTEADWKAAFKEFLEKHGVSEANIVTWAEYKKLRSGK